MNVLLGIKLINIGLCLDSLLKYSTFDGVK